MTGYSVEIKEASRQLSGKEKVKVKDTTDAIKLADATLVEPVIIDPDLYVILNVHNENAKKDQDKDYTNYLIQDKNGTSYVTGSESFWDSFMGIYEEMKDDDEEWKLKAYQVESKNYTGKAFLTCTII